MLDRIQDPGNLGTIIRVCDWFGINQIICSTDSVDHYNPKVIQSSMGSLARLSIHYQNLRECIEHATLPVFGAFLNGENLYQKKLDAKNAFILLGNEGNGISQELEQLVNHKITIPQTNVHQKTESLNVSIASSLIIGEFKRQQANFR